jgi:hypothetical protein
MFCGSFLFVYIDEIQRLIGSLRRAELTQDPEAMSEFSEEANKVHSLNL